MQAGFLFELAVKATLVIGATWALVRIMSRASAAARSSAWTWGLMFILALPPCIALLPSWSTETLPFSPMRRAVGAIVSDLGIDDTACPSRTGAAGCLRRSGSRHDLLGHGRGRGRHLAGRGDGVAARHASWHWRAWLEGF